jgi:hypothetical protein
MPPHQSRHISTHVHIIPCMHIFFGSKALCLLTSHLLPTIENASTRVLWAGNRWRRRADHCLYISYGSPVHVNTISPSARLGCSPLFLFYTDYVYSTGGSSPIINRLYSDQLHGSSPWRSRCEASMDSFSPKSKHHIYIKIKCFGHRQHCRGLSPCPDGNISLCLSWCSRIVWTWDGMVENLMGFSLGGTC